MQRKQTTHKATTKHKTQKHTAIRQRVEKNNKPSCPRPQPTKKQASQEDLRTRAGHEIKDL